MEKASNLIFGISFSLFNLGFILSQYFDFGFDLILVFGIASVLGLILMVIKSRLKDLLGSLIFLTIIAFILSLTTYLNSIPYSKIFKISGLVLGLIISIKQFMESGFDFKASSLFKHPFLNHPVLKISIALTITSFMFKIMHWEYQIEVFKLISLSLIVWSVLKFIKPQIKNVP